MHVRVEEVVHEDLREEDAHAKCGERPPVDAKRAQSALIPDRDPPDPFEDQNPRTGVLPKDAGHMKTEFGSGVAAQDYGVCRFEREVKLTAERAVEFGDDLPWPQTSSVRVVAFDESGEKGQEIEISSDRLFDAGAEDFDDHVFASGQTRGVHLGEGGRGQRAVLEAGEKGFGRSPELGGNDPPSLLSGEGRNTVLKPRELLGIRFRQKITAGRESLAEFDVNRPEGFKGETQSHRERCLAANPVPGEEGDEPPERTEKRGEDDELVESVAHEDPLDTGKPEG